MRLTSWIGVLIDNLVENVYRMTIPEAESYKDFITKALLEGKTELLSRFNDKTEINLHCL